MKSETSGSFRNVLERLMMDPVELDCFELKQAVKGAGTNEEALIEILASRSNKRIQAINDTYQKSISYLNTKEILIVFRIVYSKALEKDVHSDTSGDFRSLLTALMQGERPKTKEVDMDEVRKDAQSLIDAGSKKFKGDDAGFNRLFRERSDLQLKLILEEFAKLSKKSVGRKKI